MVARKAHNLEVVGSNPTPAHTLCIMENLSIFITIFVAALLLSITSYSIYIGFGPPSADLRDPFDEHED